MTPDIKIADKSDIAYFIGCTAGYNQQVLGVSTARILNKLNVPFMVLGEAIHMSQFLAEQLNDGKIKWEKIR